MSDILCSPPKDNPNAFQGVPEERAKIVCHKDDLVCRNIDIVLPSHLFYGSEEMGAAADFVIALPA